MQAFSLLLFSISRSLVEGRGIFYIKIMHIIKKFEILIP